jgi:enolase-phosphatase E1
VEAQRLLLGYSTAGDLRNLISEWFDTGVGPKTDPQSYQRIADSLRLTPSSILFATDHLGEAAAAGTAGMPVALSLRGVIKPEDVSRLSPAPALVAEDVMRAVVEFNLQAEELIP